MGADTKKTIVPPLPAPTETESTTLGTPTELATDVSKPGDENSSYSLPEDGTPVTIRTRGHRASKSQTSLLIEYFEGGKSSPGASGDHSRKPSVRVRLTPSSKDRRGEAERGHIKITETKSRKASLSRRTAASRGEIDAHSALTGDLEDAKSMSSYASATEESNVSRNPIDIEIDRSGNVRRRRPASPLIPAADGSKISYAPGSDISAIPTDSFLDGSGPTTSTFKMSEVRSRSRSPSRSRVGDVLGGAAAGLAAAAVADKIRSKSRGESRDRERDRVSVSKTRDKDRKHKSSKSRTSSLSKEEKYSEGTKSPRRKSSRSHADSTISAADSSVVSSGLSSHRTSDQQSIRSGTSKASINNPKLLETVEDAIRRLILPELDALKREQSRHKQRRSSATSSSSLSREDFTSERRRSSSGTVKNDITPRSSLRDKETRDREARHDFDDSPSISGVGHESVEEIRHMEDTPMRSHDHLKAAAAGAGLAGAAIAMHEALKTPTDDKRSRRRRRAEMRGRVSDHTAEEFEEDHAAPTPPMPLMASELNPNPSEVTRASILSAETDRPHSASEELTPVREVSREQLSIESSPTPTRGPTLAALGAQHENISHGDLRTLPTRRGTGEFVDGEEEYAEQGIRHQEFEEDDYDDQHDYPSPGNYDYYNSHQDVPPPLKYVPYHPERRGLSPIPSISGYTEGGSEAQRNSGFVQESSVSSSDKSVRQDRALHSPSSIPSNIMGREFGEDERSLRSSGVDYRNTMSAEGSEVDRVTSGQAVRALGANPNFVHTLGIESNVASLVDGSMLDESLLTGESSLSRNQAYGGEDSEVNLEHHYEDRQGSPTKQSVGSQRDYTAERAGTSVSGSQRSREFAEEYEVDEYGRKVPVQRSKYRQSPTTSEAAITGAAVTAAAAALKAHRERQHPVEQVLDDHLEPIGVQRNKSFKERAMHGHQPGTEPGHNVRRLEDQPKMGFSAMPHPDDLMPDSEWQDELETNPSILNGEEGFTVKKGYQHYDDEQDPGDLTPTRHTPQPHQANETYEEHHDGYDSPISASREKTGGLGLTEAAGAAALGAAAVMAAKGMHSRQSSQSHQDHDEEWQRTSDDRKRDTLVTNPYEGASPIVNLPGLGVGDPAAYQDDGYSDQYRNSPLEHKDEGYISQGPNKSPDVQKGKGVDFNIPAAMPGTGIEDPFFTPKHQRHLSGMSQGMGSPMYDAAMGTGIERIESKDIIALMQHLMVRDAQRSARDTEILVTLVRSAAEMRNSFEDIKKMLVDTEDVIITEVKENTEQSVQRAINGPRPYPGSAPRSVQGIPSGSQAGTVTGDDLPAKKRNLFRRALKGLGTKGTNDLTRIEDMLNQLLNEVDVLKEQTARGPVSLSPHDVQSFGELQPEGQYEQDHGYEPEGHAGTSTTSHASQSGHLSIPNSRAASTRLGYDRKVSGNRISTVPEANEDEYEHVQVGHQGAHDSNEQYLMTPATEQRAGSVPLGTPPQTQVPVQTSVSQDNTPKTEEGKKHKSGTRASWFPKISRWSETTTSSVAQAFRRSGQSRKNDEEIHSPGGNFLTGGPSRSESIGSYSDNFQFQDPNPPDKLHTGFTEEDLTHGGGYHPEEVNMSQHHQGGSISQDLDYETLEAPPPIRDYRGMTPEDPKYKAHRNSLNLQHPQPYRSQAERFKANLESQALGYDSSMSPHSADWAGSATSLNRLPRNPNRESYDSAGNQQGQFWTSSPAQAGITATSGPPIPPKEPLSASSPGPEMRGMGMGTPPKNNRINKLQKASPLPHHSVESGYGTMTHGVPTASYISHSRDGSSPRFENRNLSGALGVPTRRPSGPRAMTQSPKSGRESLASDEGLGSDERRRKRGES
ncbi:hypothetical protein GQ53DRAFT_645132 [Thozetella sp. PMI_491]|nr:hypothetical protein GQ53DRAFT_645132 [Thozetella sp. PMI_491]